ncbi:MAG: SRPBCC domain-containing protein [Fimbriimonadaceae bacterium]|nr:MAG: SRPBCC domain-containing protein [Fimbriimonadaceae bacterium]
MKIELRTDNEVSDASCKASTGKTLTEWFAWIDQEQSGKGRRDAIQALYDATGRGKDVWWPTVIWVEYEKSKGIVKKDGLAEGFNICSTKTIAASVDDCYNAFVGSAKEGDAYSDSGGNQGTWTRLRPGKDARIAWQTAGVETPTQVDVAFADKGKGKTGVTLMHQRIQTPEESDGVRRAWAEYFDSMKTKLEG